MPGLVSLVRDFAEARALFDEAAEQAGLSVSSHALEARGPDGEPLSIEVAVGGPESAERALVISSGLHGVEGYFGSLVQRAWLAQHEPAPELRTVVIHVMNPFGFAWRRRTNEQNVDLNRNFLLAGEPYRGAHPAYARLAPLLEPTSAPSRFDLFLPRALLAIARSGFSALKNAVAQGQYEYPTGLFFGGRAPSPLRHFIDEQLGALLGQARRVLHLDLHTGRGASATCTLCVDLPSDSARVAALRRAFPEQTVEAFDPRGVLYEVRGGLGRYLEQRLDGRSYDHLLAEFGTYPALSVLSALRAENRAHHHGRPGSREYERAKEGLVEAFCPRSERWRDAALARALRLLSQAEDHLAR